MDTGVTAHMFAHPGNLASFTPVTTDHRIIVGEVPHYLSHMSGTLLFLLISYLLLCLTYLWHLILLRTLFPFVV